MKQRFSSIGHPRRVVIAAAAVLAAACGSSTSTPTPLPANPYAINFSPTWLSANQNAGGTPQQGGTLTMVGQSDVSHLDPTAEYETYGFVLERAWTRQLYTHPASTDLNTAYSVVPDVAASMPTVSADGKTYTIKLRTDVMWDSSPARAVTAGDFVRAFKRLCNPVAPTGAPQYYTNTIAGFGDYCTAFGKVGGDVASIKKYMDGNEISGVKANDDTTLTITLSKPATDFLDIIALPFVSAVPQEYEDYLPDSADLRAHLLSDGPYKIAKYTAGQEIDLDRNTAWTQSSDSNRHQYVDHIRVTEGQSQTAVEQQIEANTADLQWDQYVPTASLHQLETSGPGGGFDPRLGEFPTPNINPYFVFNLKSPNNSGALANVKVRQALEYAVDKVAIGKVYGGVQLNRPLNQVIPPGQIGHEDFNLYPTPNDQGDPNMCKKLLGEAGVTNLTLKLAYWNTGTYAAAFVEAQKDFAACGVTVKGVPSDTINDLIGNVLLAPAQTTGGGWDLGEVNWYADWYGNNARTFFSALFDGRSASYDYGMYNSDALNSLIDQALTSQSVSVANDLWHKADMQVMQDAAIIPVETQYTPLLRSTRVHNAIFNLYVLYDPTQVWLSS